ncbi:MAG: ABC transporter permease, partial [Gemmatimonadales bacterium]|nr:ABC transporter permease [Gemmatimonadales bacterium]
FGRALTMDVGKPLDHLVISQFDLRQQQYTAESAQSFFQQLAERVNASPAVVAAGASILDPELGDANNVIRLSDSADAPRIQVSFDEVGAGYFDAAGLRILAGRTFSDAEVRRADPVVVVDQRFADEHFGGRAVGQRLALGGAGGPTHEIIGVVNSTRPVGVDRRPLPTYFIPIGGLRYLEAKLWVRYRGDAAPVMAAIKAAAAEIDAEVTPALGTIEANVQTALLPVKIATGGLSALGGLALVLAGIGLFGVIAFSVGRRTREIAIRVALGAAPRRVVALLVRQGLSPVLVGTGIGLVLAVAGGHLIRAMLYGLSPFDPIAIGGVVLAVGLASALAFWIPARRATAVQPGSVLRGD